jgi:hypothetical protein
LRLVRGAFERAHPDRGRFREFVKRALYNLVVDHHRARRRQPDLLGDAAAGVADDPGDFAQLDAEFVAGWRDELLERAWDSLAADERRGGQPYHAVLKLRTEQPDCRSPQLAAELSTRLGRAVDAAWVRKNLQRARERFSDCLIAEVARGLESADPQLIADDLEELGLLDYCREALARFE